MASTQIRYSAEHVSEAKALRAEGLSFREIARRLEVRCHKVVAAWVRGEAKPHSMMSPGDYHNGHVPKQGYEKLSPSKAYLLGVSCGDGSVYKANKVNDGLVFGVTVKDVDFADAICEAWLMTYGYEATHPRSKRGYARVQSVSKTACEDLLRYFSSRPTTLGWLVPEEITEATEGEKGAFLRGLFDSDAGVHPVHQQIVLWSTNELGLKSVSSLLDSIGIDSSVHPTKLVTRPGNRRYFLAVRAVSRAVFKAKVGFSIKRKMDRIRVEQPKKGEASMAATSGQRRATYTAVGRNGAGVVAIVGAAVGDIVSGILGQATAGNAPVAVAEGAYEQAITVADEIQQVSVANLSANTYHFQIITRA